MRKVIKSLTILSLVFFLGILIFMHTAWLMLPAANYFDSGWAIIGFWFFILLGTVSLVVAMTLVVAVAAVYKIISRSQKTLPKIIFTITFYFIFPILSVTLFFGSLILLWYTISEVTRYFN